MRHRALLLGVLFPAALSHAFYGALADRRHDRPERHGPRFERIASSYSYDARPPLPPHAPEPMRMRRMRTGRCEAREVHVLTAPAGPTGRIALETGGGELDMDAVEGLDRVEVEATLCASSTDQLQRLGVTLSADGDPLRLTTIESPDSDGYGRVDLTVRVPLGMQATITEHRMLGGEPPRGRLRRNR
jgi:hypothetical protein